MWIKSLLRKFIKVIRISKHPSLLPSLRYGVAAGIDHIAVLSHLRPKTIIDVGANIGQFSLIASNRCPDAKIFAFEPIPEAADVFEKVFEKNPRVSLVRCAIGENLRTDKFHISAHNDSSSLLPIADLQAETHPGTHEVGQIDVEVKPLEHVLNKDVLESPTLLKIDVQGAELEVLKGCATLLENFDQIYVELSFVEFYSKQPLCHEVVEYLAQRDFHLTGVYNLAQDQNEVTVQADFLFSRK